MLHTTTPLTAVPLILRGYGSVSCTDTRRSGRCGPDRPQCAGGDVHVRLHHCRRCVLTKPTLHYSKLLLTLHLYPQAALLAVSLRPVYPKTRTPPCYSLNKVPSRTHGPHAYLPSLQTSLRRTAWRRTGGRCPCRMLTTGRSVSCGARLWEGRLGSTRCSIREVSLAVLFDPKLLGYLARGLRGAVERSSFRSLSICSGEGPGAVPSAEQRA